MPARSRRVSEATSRTVKVEYVLVPYQPQYAILTGGDLDMSGQMTVHVVPNGPSDGAAVHTNGVLSGNANSIDVQGPMSYTAGATGKAVGWGTQAPEEYIPHVSALNFYKQQEGHRCDEGRKLDEPVFRRPRL